MARFDVYPTPIAEERRHTPYWLDLQADHLQSLATRVVVPLRRRGAQALLTPRLNPEFTVDNVAVYADMANIAAYPFTLLRRPVANLRQDRMTLDDALDLLFMGY
jgi:toxin CcdB